MWPQTMGWFPFNNFMEEEHSNNGELSQNEKNKPELLFFHF